MPFEATVRRASLRVLALANLLPSFSLPSVRARGQNQSDKRGLSIDKKRNLAAREGERRIVPGSEISIAEGNDDH